MVWRRQDNNQAYYLVIKSHWIGSLFRFGDYYVRQI
jgi:hypothetical protein